MFFNMHFRNNSAGYTGTVNQMLSKFILLLRIHGSILPYILFTIVQLWRTCFVSLLWVLRYECFIFECKCGRVWLCCLCLCSNVFLPQSIASLLPFFFEKKNSYPWLRHDAYQAVTDFLIWIVVILISLVEQSNTFSCQIPSFYEKLVE